MFTTSIITVLSTAVASAAHGGNYLSKGIILAIHLILVTGALYLQLGVSPYLAVSLVACSVYWFIIRNGKIARAELTYQRLPTKDNMIKILTSYAPSVGVMTTALITVNWYYPIIYLIISVIGIIIPSVLLNNHTKLGHKLWLIAHKKNVKEGNTDKVIDNRRIIEFATGLTVGGFTIIGMFAILIEYI